jgi:3-deoxy-7-phosphoheptulonate synthase
MVIVMQRSASEEQIQAVIDRLIGEGFDVHRSTGVGTVLGVWGKNSGSPGHEPWR